jgi:hypothetical protein
MFIKVYILFARLSVGEGATGLLHLVETGIGAQR